MEFDNKRASSTMKSLAIIVAVIMIMTSLVVIASSQSASAYGIYETGRMTVTRMTGTPGNGAVSMEFTPMQNGIWWAHVENHALSAVSIEIIDITGIDTILLSEKLSFSGKKKPVAETQDVLLEAGRTYLMKASPHGPNRAYAIVIGYFEFPNIPPIAQIYAPYSGTVGSLIEFYGWYSYDPDGNITSYEWNFGDGSRDSGYMVTHAYSSYGYYLVTLTVTDDYGATGVANQTIEIIPDIPPVAQIMAPYSGVDKRPMTFDGSYSYDPDGYIASYQWNFGDGNVSQGDGNTSQGSIVNHAFSTIGYYIVTLTVTDNSGSIGITNHGIDIIPNQPPTALIDALSVGYANRSVRFSGQLSYDPDGMISSYAWDFGDGGTAFGAIVSHAYHEIGAYVVSLTVTDDSGASDIATQSIEINPSLSGQRETDWRISNLFESHLKSTNYSELGKYTDTMGLNSWWNLRVPQYGECIIRDSYPFLMAENFYANGGFQTTRPVDPGFRIFSFYREEIKAKNVSEVGTAAGMDPYFIPILGDSGRDGGVVNISWHGSYLRSAELTAIRAGTHYANKYYGVPGMLTPRATTDDGWYFELHGLMSFDRAAAIKFLNLSGIGNLKDEFVAASADINSLWLNDWMIEGGYGGQFDTYTGYGYSNDIRYICITMDPSSTPDNLVLRIWCISWGMEVLLMRYLEAANVAAHWQSYFEDFNMNASFDQFQGDFDISFVAQYHVMAWADGSLGAWMMEADHIDGAGEIYPEHMGYISPYDPYDPDQGSLALRPSYAPGTTHFGMNVNYWAAPQKMDLAKGETLTIELPENDVIGFHPYVGLTDQLSPAKAQELLSHSYWGRMELGNCSSNMRPFYDSMNNTIRIIGPIIWPSNSHPLYPNLLLTGTPMFVFTVVNGTNETGMPSWPIIPLLGSDIVSASNNANPADTEMMFKPE